MKRCAFYLSAIFILIVCPAFAGSINTDEADTAAQQYYAHGEYDKAIDIYMEQLKGGEESGPLYYDLGNCYLQKGDSLGKAIFFYKMAQRLIPRDAEVLVNLNYARSLMKQGEVPSGESFILHILRMAFDRFTLSGAFALWNTCYFGCAIFFVLSLFMKKMKGPLRFTAVLLFCTIIIMLIPLRAKISHEEYGGIVIVPVADARFEPFEDAASKFPLYEGMETQVLKTAKDWYKVKRPDGKVGWLPKNSLWQMAEPAGKKPLI